MAIMPGTARYLARLTNIVGAQHRAGNLHNDSVIRTGSRFNAAGSAKDASDIIYISHDTAELREELKKAYKCMESYTILYDSN